MHDQYEAIPLKRQRIDQAFPVVRTAFPKLGLERWRSFAEELVGPDEGARRRKPAGAANVAANVVELPVPKPRGIVAAQLGRHYIHGVFAYHVVPSLCHGRVLQVDLFVALDLFDPAACAEALMREMDRLAKVLQCEAVHVSLPRKPSEDLVARFADLGHAEEGVRLCKDLVQVAAE